MQLQRTTIRVWDWPLRLFHWLLVIAIAVAFLGSEEDSVLNDWHVLTGWVVAVLLVFRIVWGFIGGEHSRFSDFVHPSRIAEHVSGLFNRRAEPELGHNPLGAVAVLVLLALIAAVVGTGAFRAGEDLHETIAWVLLAMVAVHVLAVIAMSVLSRENLARAMVTGRKQGARHPGAHNARSPSAGAFLIGFLVVAGTVYAITRYDPAAFTLRSAESFEHRAGGGEHARAGEEERHDEY